MAKLAEFCEINMGQSPESSSYNEAGKGIPFFQGNADFGIIHPKVRVWCNAPTKIAHPNDILISVRAPIGALNIANVKCCIGRGLASLTADEKKCHQKYLWYALESKVDELNSKGTGSTFKAIGKSVLFDTEISLPSLKHQKEIAHIFDRVTTLIMYRKEQLISLENLVKSRFIEMFGSLVIGDKFNENKCKIGDIASVTKLAGFEFTKYIQYKEQGDIIMLRGLNCKKGHLILDDIKWIDKGTSDLLPRSKLYFGDILMTYAGTIGDVAMVDEDDKYHLAPNVAKITLHDKKECNPLFLIHLFMYSHDYIMTFASQVAQASINMEKIRNFEYFFPPIELQNDFATFVKQTDKLKFDCQTITGNTKKSLMQQYFDNLERLGLISRSVDSWISNESVYEQLKNHKFIKDKYSIMEKMSKNMKDFKEISYKKGYCDLSSFGKAFCSICLDPINTI